MTAVDPIQLFDACQGSLYSASEKAAIAVVDKNPLSMHRAVTGFAGSMGLTGLTNPIERQRLSRGPLAAMVDGVLAPRADRPYRRHTASDGLVPLPFVKP